MSALDATQLLRMTPQQLDELFRKSESGPIPNGEAQGTALIAPGSPVSEEIAKIVKLFAWQGKTFDAGHSVLRNRVSPFGVNAIAAQIYKQASWFDNKECIVLDYSKTSTLAHWIRDEIRLIAPNLYLGLAYWQQTRIVHFALQFP